MRAPLRSCADPTVRAAAPRPCFRRGHPPALFSRGLARGLSCPCYAPAAGHLSTAASESVLPSPSRASPCTRDAPAACPTQHHQHHTHQPSLYVVLQSMSRGVASAYALQVVVQRAWQARGAQRGAIGHEEQREATTGGWHNPKLWKRCVGAMGARRCNGVARAGGRPW